MGAKVMPLKAPNAIPQASLQAKIKSTKD